MPPVPKAQQAFKAHQVPLEPPAPKVLLVLKVQPEPLGHKVQLALKEQPAQLVQPVLLALPPPSLDQLAPLELPAHPAQLELIPLFLDPPEPQVLPAPKVPKASPVKQRHKELLGLRDQRVPQDQVELKVQWELQVLRGLPDPPARRVQPVPRLASSP